MTKEEYRIYLLSDHWRNFRRKNIAKKCWCCGGKIDLQLHHVSYENLHNENERDVVTLCKICHYQLHDIIRARRLTLAKAHYQLPGLKKPFVKRIKKKKKKKAKDGLTRKQRKIHDWRLRLIREGKLVS